MTDAYWKRERAISEALQRLEAAVLDQDLSEVDYRDVTLIVGEVRQWHRRHEQEVLYSAYDAIQSIITARYPAQMKGFDLIRGYQEYEDWLRNLLTTIYHEAENAIASPFYRGQGRVPCPLCGQGPEQIYSAEGWLVPEGLKRHLDGWGKIRRCPVITVLWAKSSQYWRT